MRWNPLWCVFFSDHILPSIDKDETCTLSFITMGLTKSSALESKLGRLSIFIFHAIFLLVVSQLKSEKKCVVLSSFCRVKHWREEARGFLIHLHFTQWGLKKKKTHTNEISFIILIYYLLSFVLSACLYSRIWF